MSQVERERGEAPARTRTPTETAATNLPQGMLRVIRQVSGKLLARTTPPDTFEPAPPQPSGVDLGALSRAEAVARVMVPEPIPSGDSLIERVDLLYARPLSETQERALLELRPDDRRQFSATLDALARLKRKKATNGEFLEAVLQSAAELAGKDRARFVELVGLSLGAPHEEAPHAAVATELLLRLFVSFQGSGGARRQGFSPEVLDETSASQLLPRLGEMLSVGKNRWAFKAQRVLEQRGAKQTPAERRMGRLALMVGRGLRMSELTPKEAAGLLQWALRADTAAVSAPCWQAEDFRLDTWLEAWRQAGGTRGH